MKMMKLALLGGAALAVTAAGARADDLSAMKAEIEALNARVAQLETAPSVPAGYQLVTVSSGDAINIPGNPEAAKFGAQVNKVTTISVMPTADAPAAASIQWSGYVEATIAYNHDKTYYEHGAGTTRTTFTTSSHYTQIWNRNQLKVVAKTDTAVGEVGVSIKMRADGSSVNFHPGVYVKEGWGWWAMTPELTLGGGLSGSLGNVGYGYDGSCTCYYTDSAKVDFDPKDTQQVRLTYASGPLSIAAAVEHSTGGGELAGITGKDNLGVAGQIKYSGDTVNGAIDGFWRNSNGGTDPYGIGAGIGLSIGDMASLSVGGQFARTVDDYDRYGVSALASMNLSDAIHAEVAGGYRHYNHGGGNNYGVLAGVYYAPVKQLTVGLEGEWRRQGRYSTGGAGCVSSSTTTCAYKSEDYTVDLVTVFAF